MGLPDRLPLLLEISLRHNALRSLDDVAARCPAVMLLDARDNPGLPADPVQAAAPLSLLADLRELYLRDAEEAADPGYRSRMQAALPTLQVAAGGRGSEGVVCSFWAAVLIADPANAGPRW